MSGLSSLANVFVYGTLKRAQPNHHWLSDRNNGFAKYLTMGKTVKKYPLVIGTRYNIPFVLDKEGTGHFIEGEIYQVDDQMIKKLDILEDYPNYYDREIQDIETGDGKISCWIYLIRKFPDAMLEKTFLQSYKNTREKPYRETYIDNSNPSDLDEEFR